MYKVGFLKPRNKYDFFAEQLIGVDDFDVEICGFGYDELVEFDVFSYDVLVVGVEDIHMGDLEIFLDKIQLFFSGVVIAVDEKFSLKRRFIMYELGVTNYFYMPFKFDDFVSFLPWFVEKQLNLIRYKDVVLNIDNRTVIRGMECLSLKNMEFRLMKYLLQNKGKIMSKDRILEDVWDMNAMVSSKTVEVHMCRLRNKIDRGYEDKLLHTIPNTGYMLR